MDIQEIKARCRGVFSQDARLMNPAQRGQIILSVLKQAPPESRLELLEWLFQETYLALGTEQYCDLYMKNDQWVLDWFEFHEYNHDRVESIRISLHGIIERLELHYQDPAVRQQYCAQLFQAQEPVGALMLGTTLYLSMVPYAAEAHCSLSEVEDKSDEVVQKVLPVYHRLKHLQSFEAYGVEDRILRELFSQCVQELPPGVIGYLTKMLLDEQALEFTPESDDPEHDEEE